MYAICVCACVWVPFRASENVFYFAVAKRPNETNGILRTRILLNHEQHEWSIPCSHRNWHTAQTKLSKALEIWFVDCDFMFVLLFIYDTWFGSLSDLCAQYEFLSNPAYCSVMHIPCTPTPLRSSSHVGAMASAHGTNAIIYLLCLATAAAAAEKKDWRALTRTQTHILHIQISWMEFFIVFPCTHHTHSR